MNYEVNLKFYSSIHSEFLASIFLFMKKIAKQFFSLLQIKEHEFKKVLRYEKKLFKIITLLLMLHTF